MAKEKKVEQITDMEVDFAQWFTDVCIKAELVDYSDVKGLFIMRPYGYAIWENIQKILDGKFKATGHQNVAMPMLIPESLLQKEKDHVEGFAPECAWVTMGGSEELPERLCVRPTSETLFCQHWSHIVHSWRDLPCLYNQWCSVIRWEKTTRPFLRGREFLWQEGHTLHATEAEARKETLQMLEIYAETCEQELAMPVIRGSIHTVLTSGSIMVLVTAVVGKFFGNPTIEQICRTISIGAFSAIILILLFLPGMLALLDRWVLPRDLRRRLYPPKAPKAPKAPKPPKAARASWP